MPKDEQQRRFEDYKDFLSGCLLAMVVGTNTEETMKTTIRTVLYCILNRFFVDEAILEHYHEAETGGLGSEAWQEIPTLRDYLKFCTLEQIGNLLQLEEGVNWNLVPNQIFGYPVEIIAQYERFLPNKQGIFTQWLLDDSGTYTFCRYYPAYVQLAVVANNPDEQAIRAEYLRQYADKFEAIASDFLL